MFNWDIYHPPVIECGWLMIIKGQSMENQWIMDGEWMDNRWSIGYLVGGLEHKFYISIQLGIRIPTDFHILQWS